MIDALKRTLYAGIGATVVTAEKIEAALQDLVERGRLSAEEAKATARKISEDSRKEFEEAQSSLKDLFNELLDKSPVLRKKDLDPIIKRIDSLEKEIAALKKQQES